MAAFSDRKGSGAVPSQTIDAGLIREIRNGAPSSMEQARKSLQPNSGVKLSAEELKARLERINSLGQAASHDEALSAIAQIGFGKILERILHSPEITKNPNFVATAERIERTREGKSESEN